MYYPREEVWKDRKIRHWEDLDEILSRFITDNTSVRFKYLDEDDILDCGFFDTDYGIYSNEPIIKFIKEDVKIIFREDGILHIFARDNLVFAGEIKNKKELQKILKQVGV